MKDEQMMSMMADVNMALVIHDADVADVITVADRLLVSAMRNVSEGRSNVDIEQVAKNVLARIEQHVRRELHIEEAVN